MNREEEVHYAVVADGLNGAVVKTTEPVNGDDVFATFTQAKAELIRWFTSMAREYQREAASARLLRKGDIDQNVAGEGS